MPEPKELTVEEAQTYQLLFDKNMSAKEVTSKLIEKGYDTNYSKVLKFKQAIAEKVDTEMRAERMMENMLESYDRTKIEFEDSVTRLKSWIEKLESEGKIMDAASVHNQLLGQINTSLKVLGKLNEKMASIRAQNVNIIASSDFAEVFKKMLHNWFEQMNVKIEDGKLVLEKPTLELIDDFQKWELDKIRKKAITVQQDESE